jgi:hypothetical protein
MPMLKLRLKLMLMLMLMLLARLPRPQLRAVEQAVHRDLTPHLLAIAPHF